MRGTAHRRPDGRGRSGRGRAPADPVALDRRWRLFFHFIGTAAVISPLFGPAVLPLLDWPQHVALVHALANAGDPTISPYYELHPQLSTYLGFYGLGALLAKMTGADLALRLLLALGLAGTPLATARLLHALRRPMWPAMLVYPAVFSMPFYWGFGAYVIAVPLAIWTIAALVRVAREDDARGSAEVVAASTLCFLTHALAFGSALLVAGVALAVRHLRHEWRHLLRAAAALVPSLACFGWWFVVHVRADQTERLGALSAVVHAQSGDVIRFDDFGTHLDQLAFSFNDWLRSDDDVLIAKAWVAAYGIAFVLGGAAAIWRWRKGVREIPWPAWLVGALLVALYFVIPQEAINVYSLYPRMMILGVAGLCLLVPAPPGRPWMAAITYGPALALTVWTGDVNVTAMHALDDEAADLRAVLAEAEPGQRLYGMVFAPNEDQLTLSTMLHFPAYYVPERGGLVGFSFANGPSFPIQLATLGASPYPGRRAEWEHHRFRYDVFHDYYDYFLTRGGGGLDRRMGAPPGALEQVASEGAWTLYRDTAIRRTVVQSFAETIHQAAAYVGAGPERRACTPWNGRELDCGAEEWQRVGPAEHAFDEIRLQCLWAHPHEGAPLEIVFENVQPEGDVIVGFAGVADSGQREGGADVTLEALVGTRAIGQVQVGARPGYRAFEWGMPVALEPQRVTFRISAPDVGARHFCFAATLFDE